MLSHSKSIDEKMAVYYTCSIICQAIGTLVSSLHRICLCY